LFFFFKQKTAYELGTGDWSSDVCSSDLDQGVQLHGGYGYMMEYPIAKAYVDSRIQTIYGGTTEIQKEIIGRALGI